MKKILLAIATVAISCGMASAAEVVLNVNDATNIDGTLVDEKPAEGSSNGTAKHYQPLNSLEISGYSFSFTAGTNKNAPAYYYNMSTSKNTQNTVRVYGSNTMTIKAPAGTEMTQIEFKGSNGDTAAQPSPSTGTMTVSGKTAMTWTGTATELTITYDKSFRITEMTIATGSSSMETVEMPTFTPASGTTFADELAVTIAGAEGATIYYTVDGTNPTKESTVYNAPIAITKTTTIKAFAAKEGMNDSGIASATYTKDEVMSTLQELIIAGLDDEKTEFTYTGKAVVTYQNGDNLYVRDETAALLVYGKLDQVYENGDVLTGFKGTFKNYYSTWELIANTTTFAASTETAAAEPKEFRIGTITETDQNEYIILRGVTIDGDLLKKDADEMPMYNKFKVEIPTTTEPQDVIGVISYYQQKGADAPALQLYPISFAKTVGIEGVEADGGVRVEGNSIVAPAGAEVYAVSGARVNGTDLQSGIYVVRVNGQAYKVLVK